MKGKTKKIAPYGSTPLQKLRLFAERAERLLFVDDCNCIVCGKELSEKTRDGLCAECRKKMPFNDEKICDKCGRIIANEAEYCNTCQSRERYFGIARSCFVYEDEAVSLVYRLKFGGKRYLAKYMANIMADKYLQSGFVCDSVIAVPLSAKRKKQRGYNQSELIARELSRQLKLDYLCGAVIKKKDNEPQAKKGTFDRELNVAGVYEAADKEAVKGRRILIVDDVLTTGATASEVARVLLKAKAKSADVLTFASTRYKVPSESNKAEREEKYEDEMV